MQTPLELSFQGWKDTDGEIEAIIREKLSKLERVCADLISCHVAIEQITNMQKKGHTYHIRIDVNIPPQHDLVVVREPEKGAFNHKPLATLIRDAFDAMIRQAKELTDRKHKKVKAHTREKQTAKPTPPEPETE